MSIPTYLDYITCDAQTYWNIPAFGYINNEDHRLVEPCGRSPHIPAKRNQVTRARAEKIGARPKEVASPQIRTALAN
jgi:hypothetical protein